MKQAREYAEQGEEFILPVFGREKGEVFVFYNNPRPLCYTYMIPGVWVLSPAEGAWRSKDGREFVAVSITRPQDLEHFRGTLVERAGARVTQGYEEHLRRPLTGVKFSHSTRHAKERGNGRQIA